MIFMEQAVRDVILNNGMYSIPLDVFSCDWGKLNTMFHNVVKKYQRYRPVVKKEVMNVDNIVGAHIPSALQIKSVAFWSATMIPSQTVPLDTDEYDFDPNTRILKAVGSSMFLVSYLSEYTYTTTPQHVTEETYSTLLKELKPILQLTAVPDITSIEIKVDDDVYTAVNRNSKMIQFEGPGSDRAVLTLGNLALKFEFAENGTRQIDVSYNAQYPALQNMDSVDEFLSAWLGSEILKSIGGIKLVTKFDSLPTDITADGLMEYGRTLAEQVLDFQDRKSSWYEWLPT